MSIEADQFKPYKLVDAVHSSPFHFGCSFWSFDNSDDQQFLVVVCTDHADTCNMQKAH